ncbi:hypothetical protein AL036_03845 [Salipiger aestuarii]|uniref:phosphotransferase family protein n=1 Tax=Salipiger aestuarii TaxID=568098 RepID=UPI00025B837B|nr:aminoglycoside phosphotransferase family protein [Salipiger aestuarii]EIE51947.1 aminoglycoside phosphotransferase [Citreicella sp. 357]KAA8609514.1 hypothetical protein AL036_03845 [Salipiger aestuarii]
MSTPADGPGPAATHIDIRTARDSARLALARHCPAGRFGLGSLRNAAADRRAHVFCAATPDARLVVKVFAPSGGDKGRAQFARQDLVATALPGRAPEVLFYDDELRVLGMRYVDGPSLAEIWPTLTPPEQLAKLERAGDWLAAFHALTVAPHPFRPRGPLDWLIALAESHRQRRREIPDFAVFEQHVAELQGAFPRVRGTPSQRAILHRDLHLSNLMQTRDGLVGLDFENNRPDEPLRDLVWLLVDAMARGDPEQPPHPAASALAAGYRQIAARADAMIFIQRLVALGIWANTTTRPSQHNVARFVAARQIAGVKEPLFQV